MTQEEGGLVQTTQEEEGLVEEEEEEEGLAQTMPSSLSLWVAVEG